MKTWKVFIMAAVTILGASCAKENTAEQKAPITKPQITIEGGRLTPEGLWAMGRIGSVKSDIETGLLAYTVSHYSVEENNLDLWVRENNNIRFTNKYRCCSYLQRCYKSPIISRNQ